MCARRLPRPLLIGHAGAWRLLARGGDMVDRVVSASSATHATT